MDPQERLEIEEGLITLAHPMLHLSISPVHEQAWET